LVFNQDLYDGKTATLLGWGSSFEHGKQSETLKRTILTIHEYRYRYFRDFKAVYIVQIEQVGVGGGCILYNPLPYARRCKWDNISWAHEQLNLSASGCALKLIKSSPRKEKYRLFFYVDCL